MSENKKNIPQIQATDNDPVKPIRIVMPIIVIALILQILGAYTYVQRRNVVRSAEQVANQMAEYMANNIANEMNYAKSNIRLVAINVAQTMTSAELENPSEVILPMVENSPFGGIEYIRSDGMNIMNIGEPFDASDRVYYIEGIKGNTGIWNNYHPKSSQETLVNFYTPLIYEGQITGVITGYIEATSQLAPLFENQLYGKTIYGFLADENNMVICSTLEGEYEKDYTVDMLMDKFDASFLDKQRMRDLLKDATDTAATYRSTDGEGRVCITTIPGTEWKVAIIIPRESFDEIINENTQASILTIITISAILVAYATYVLLRSLKRRKEIVKANAKLEEENRAYDEKNRRVFAEMSEIRDIIASAKMGTWRIELVDGQPPRMYADEMMKELLGINGHAASPEQTYEEWYSRIRPEALQSVQNSVERMKKGYFDENTYLWNHPAKGTRYVRCGGTSQIIAGGHVLRGYHYDVDEVVREDQAKVDALMTTLSEKNEYYSALGTLERIFYSMHVIDIFDDTVVELNSKNEVKAIVNRKQGAVEMMTQVMNAVVVDEYLEEAQTFTDLASLPERMRGKRILSKELVGKHTGWFLASFITMEVDIKGKPTKVLFTTRVIDEEKKQEARLIQRSQTDELTGLLNRRAYEEDIYVHNNVPEEDEFVYVSLDVNGLKVVNDTKGHVAGDELLTGACWCMKHSLGAYGRLYRVGGDEFVAILFCDVQKTKEILEEFDNTIINWTGEVVDELSISYGWISKHEQEGLSVRQLGAIAEQRMYDAKSEYYKKMGVDRRGQHDAHKALCDLYTKILRINTSTDTYQIINMDVAEQVEEMGFSEKISQWLRAFGTSGQVHPDDLDEYLRMTDISYIDSYFAGGKTSLHIFYRRRCGDVFKQVMMEIIPAGDFSEANHSLFLYVKDVDR